MKALISFEFSNYTRKIWFYVTLLVLMALGFLVATKMSLTSIPNVFKNAPYSNTYLIGLLSLICIFISSLLSANVLFKEKDSNFGLILYTTPISKTNYLWSRFLVVFGITLLFFLVIVVGYALGQQMPWLDSVAYAPFNLWHYLQPFLLLAVPNAFFCSAMVCNVGWSSKNKLLVYISGLFIYILYMVGMIFSGSPMMVGSLPPSAEAMDLSAKFDPFGLSAFFQQTMHWSAPQRNTELVSLTGNMLFNRLFFITFSLTLFFITFRKFKFNLNEKGKRIKEPKTNEIAHHLIFKTVSPQLFNIAHQLKSVLSFVKTDLKFVIKSIPFILILVGLGFYMSMEFYGEIDKGIRIPENFASTGLLSNRILKDFPGLCLIVLLFYSNETIWRSRNVHFNMIEDATPTKASNVFFAKWLSLNVIVFLLLTWIMMIAVIFQISYQYTHIKWSVYGSLFYLIGVPLMLNAAMLVCIQWLIKTKYLGLIVSSIFILLTTTSIGKMMGLTHPLIRFNAPYGGKLSDMNGWGAYFNAFGWKILFGIGLTLFIAITVSKLTNQPKLFSRKILSPSSIMSMIGFAIVTTISGIFIFNKVDFKGTYAEMNWQQGYEQTYRPFQNLPQPTITDVKTDIDLFPENNAYNVSARYTLENKTATPIEKLLVYANKSIQLKGLDIEGGILDAKDEKFGHYWINLSKPLQPSERIIMNFLFDSGWDGFNGHESFNAIVANGSFMRISNYFPKLGYQQGNEIDDEKERAKRNLGKATPILALDAPRSAEDDFINLDAVISTVKGQTAIGIGELVNTWQNRDRNYFHYKTHSPIPFRIGISSAKYAVKKVLHNGIRIAVYYHPEHHENVAHLIENAKHTLTYCENNFGKYPFKAIRFAEVSAFTSGFAATAYPATIFMTEDVIFHANISGDKQQDVINELAGHELSHEWWGTSQLAPDGREGSNFLTETLAMYTELMLVKKMHGRQRVLDNVQMHHDIYLSERGFSDEQPLYKTNPKSIHQHYAKGLVTMYQLSELIGEEKVNQALKNFLKKHAYPNPAPVSTDLLDELYAICNPSIHARIDDLFKHITVYDFQIMDATNRRMNNQYEVGFEVEIQKFQEDGQGRQTPVDFNDNIEIGFYFEDGKRKLISFPVRKNQLKTQVVLHKEPVKMVIDPEMKFIKTSAVTTLSHRF
ncbi:ABC transporter permease/M1 family aminopeptidase [Parapedobacter tibetensis]|uniref:ABC transporter permease/M1 family aminopeptidase n=1 Tax=Parapedobacter tibetensis TaxID=2972951 RepID=UPI00214DC15A|nr:M1 family aminopeptidase [Parapedobacter tibetensis]